MKTLPNWILPIILTAGIGILTLIYNQQSVLHVEFVEMRKDFHRWDLKVERHETVLRQQGLLK